MELALILLKQVVIMLVYLFVGFICFKTGLITKEGNKSISNLVLYVTNPMLILISYQQDFSFKLLKGLGQTLLLTVIGYGVLVLLTVLLVKNKDGLSRSVERFSVIYSNCGFMGIPIAKVLLGSEGVFYITAFNTVFNILVWTHGVYLISSDKKQMNLKKIIANPTIIATVTGFVLFVLDIRLPEVPYTAVDNISSMVGPLAMIVAGATIARTDLLKAVLKPKIYYVSLLKLVVYPLVCIAVFNVLPLEINYTALLTTELAFACPAATMCTMFAIKYEKNSTYAAEIFAVTTLLSVVTMPVMIFVQELLK